MNVLHAVSEIYPLVKTGGLADVAAALPPALAVAGVPARILVPAYPAVRQAMRRPELVLEDAALFGGGPAQVMLAELEGIAVPAYVLDCPGLFGRDGNPYLGPDRQDWPDNHRRFAALGWAAARLGLGADPQWRPDIVHGHDWQAGLAPAYLSFWAGAQETGGGRPRTVTTIHNIGFPGWFPAETAAELGLPPESLSIDGLEYFGGVGFLKAGLYYADRITTVSRTYAQEIQTPDYGYALSGLLAARAADLVGIVNGADYGVWDPRHDPHLPAPYGPDDLSDKAASKAALLREFGLPEDDGAPLFAMVSRLTGQKGCDLLLHAIPALVAGGGRLALLGSGDAELEAGFRAAATEYPDHVAVRIGYDEVLSHLVQAGADVLLVPSRTEPCGLTQIYALRYGTLPLVRRTGGLADTVVNASHDAIVEDRATGFSFDDPTATALAGTISWVCGLWRDRALWAQLQRRAMAQDFSWDRAARDYVDLYRDLLATP
ncbi:glycogen synthase GlgA [Inquilinus limosus]|uniref:glycogen synthase GlgA n=1 Tax=Inquilinus limosus TaxID=171674 RepID=UPI00041D6755|nr:glycogen synthase GlgA [Inquilinus limosus]